jgi:hemolysin D
MSSVQDAKIEMVPSPRASKAPAPPSRPAQLKPADREFLPASLEILLTPPSPIARALLLTICGVFFFTLVWSYFGWIDIHAVAPGKIQPSGRSKVVQPLEAGKVVAIRVENGSRVNAGDVLLELDPTETFADREAQARDLEAASAEALRRKVAIAAAQTSSLQPLPIEFTSDIGQLVRQREEGVLSADLAQLRSSTLSLRAQLAEKFATKERLVSTIAAREKLIALAKERVVMREELDAKGAGSRALVIEALQQYETQITTDVGDRGQLIETDAAMRSLERKIEEAVTQFVADQTQKLAEVERKRDRLVQELVKAQSKTDRTQLKAPIAGTIQQLAVATVGQVVSSGQSLLTIVPLDGAIEIEAMIANKDIGFVQSGQSAVVKVEAFPFTRYGVIEGSVVKVSRDAVDDRDATNLSDAANAAKPQAGASTQSSRTQNLVFPATIRLAQRTIDIDGKEVALTPGMAVTVEIKTGQRRAIDYVLSPLREITAQAARER